MAIFLPLIHHRWYTCNYRLDCWRLLNRVFLAIFDYNIWSQGWQQELCFILELDRASRIIIIPLLFVSLPLLLPSNFHKLLSVKMVVRFPTIAKLSSCSIDCCIILLLWTFNRSATASRAVAIQQECFAVNFWLVTPSPCLLMHSTTILLLFQ